MKITVRMGILLLIVLFMSSLGSVLAEESLSGTWEMNFYVDEFRLPTGEAYICNAEPIVGIFSNSAVTDELCHLTILEDEENICFILYEYGKS